jgi:hypothetical protein
LSDAHPLDFICKLSLLRTLNDISTMTIHESQTSSRSNMETGVPGFDEILGGGLVGGASVVSAQGLSATLTPRRKT